MPNGRFPKHNGGILLTAILMVGMMSMLLLFLLSNYRTATEFSSRTRRYYEMQIMTELFLADYLQQTDWPAAGEVYYNTGRVTYSLEAEQLTVTAFAGKYKSVHYETIESSDTEATTTSTEIESESEEESREETTDTSQN